MYIVVKCAKMSASQKPVPFSCSLCATTFSAMKSLLRHQSSFHGRSKAGFECILCGTKIVNNVAYCEHLTEVHAIKINAEATTLDSKEGKLNCGGLVVVFLTNHLSFSIDF